MTTARRLAVLLAAALPLALAGCGAADSCPVEIPKVNSVPANNACALAADAVVTVTIPLCTRCNQTLPSCEVVPPSGTPGDNDFQLDLFAQACTDASSCGLSCPQQPPVVTCRFRTPAVSGTVSYDFVIVDENANSTIIPFTVGAGGSLSCTG